MSRFSEWLLRATGPVLEKVGVLRPVFRVYESFLALESYRRNLQYRTRGAQDGLPLPPADLIVRVAGSADIAGFLEGGARAAASIRETLEKHGCRMSGLKAMLDFGCGCGRVLRWWKDLPEVELHGADYNPELVRWCAANLPHAKVTANQLHPPTSYPEQSFDLIYALSVFTHLPETAQGEWMQEFHRLLTPGGWLLVTTHGREYLPRLAAHERDQFTAGRLVVRYEQSAGTNLCCTFHPEAYVRGALADSFEVRDFVPAGAKGNPRQDLWLLRAPAAQG